MEVAENKRDAIFSDGIINMALDTPEEFLQIFDGTITVFAGHSPMKAACVNCPFVMADRGQDYLAPGRLDRIKVAKLLGQSFPCHKTVYQQNVELEIDDEGNEAPPSWHIEYKECAGAIEWTKKFAQENERDVDVNGHAG